MLGPGGCGRQLALTFLKDAPLGLTLTTENFLLTGDTVARRSINVSGQPPPQTIR